MTITEMIVAARREVAEHERRRIELERDLRCMTQPLLNDLRQARMDAERAMDLLKQAPLPPPPIT